MYKLFPHTTSIYDRVLYRPERYLIEQGGTGSGKTYGILQALLNVCVNPKRYPATGNDIITIVGQDLPNLKRDAIRQFLTILNGCELAKTLLISPAKPTENNTLFQFATGWKVEFVAYETAQDAQAGKRRILYVNEGNGVKQSIFEQLEMRTADKVIIDYNPTSKFWAFNMYLNPDLSAKENVRFSVTTYRDNPHMPEAIRKEIEKMKITNPEKYRIFGDGMLGEVAGKIWKKYSGIDTLPDKSQFKKYGYGLDFGFSNDVTALVFGGLYNGAIYLNELIYETGIGLEELERLFIECGVKKTETIIADSAPSVLIDYFRRKGWNITGAKKGRGSIVGGLEKLMSIEKYITRKSVNIFLEAESYVWKTSRVDGREINEPIDTYNHITDAIRYLSSDYLTNIGRAVATV